MQTMNFLEMLAQNVHYNISESDKGSLSLIQNEYQKSQHINILPYEVTVVIAN